MSANSQPVAPPPTMTAEAGSSFRSSASRLVTTTWPSMGMPGRPRGLAPVARMMWPASRVRPVPLTSTSVALRSAPSPAIRSTPCFLSSAPTPRVSLSTTRRLLSMAAPKS